MDSELGSHLNALGSELAAAKAHMAELTAEMRAKGISNHLVATLDPAVSGGNRSIDQVRHRTPRSH